MDARWAVALRACHLRVNGIGSVEGRGWPMVLVIAGIGGSSERRGRWHSMLWIVVDRDPSVAPLPFLLVPGSVRGGVR